MIQDEAAKIIAIIKTADGGCKFCVAELLEKFFKEFPEWKCLEEPKTECGAAWNNNGKTW